MFRVLGTALQGKAAVKGVRVLLQVFMGDVLSDLPEISNYTTAEAAQYASDPKTPYQMWLRRQPPAYQAQAKERARRADEAMAAMHAAQNDKRKTLRILPKGTEAVRTTPSNLMCCRILASTLFIITLCTFR